MPPHNTPISSTVQGMFWTILSGLCFVGVTVTVRYVGPDIPASQAAFLRYLLGTLMLAPVFYQLWRGTQKVGSWKMMVVRGIAHGVGVILWFYAMARIPIAEVTALGYLTPVLITAGAALFLGEKLYARRILAIVAGLVGVMIILRPGFSAISEGQIAQLLATPLFAASMLLTKRMTSTESLTVIVAGLSLVCTVILAPPAIAVWVPPTASQVALLASTALLATLGHFTLTKAYSLAPITTLQPISFLQLLWATLFGTLLFAEALNVYVFIGGALLVGASTYIAHRETLAARQQQQSD